MAGTFRARAIWWHPTFHGVRNTGSQRLCARFVADVKWLTFDTSGSSTGPPRRLDLDHPIVGKLQRVQRPSSSPPWRILS
jgi:hypothetical protein